MQPVGAIPESLNPITKPVCSCKISAKNAPFQWLRDSFALVDWGMPENACQKTLKPGAQTNYLYICSRTAWR